MARTGVIVVALASLILLLGAPAARAQAGGSAVLAQLKIDFPAGPNADKAAFTLTGAAKVNIALNLPVLTGKNRAVFMLINPATKKEIWSATVDASRGPVKSTEARTLQPGTYRLVYEFTGEPGALQNARWSGTLSVSK